MLEEEKELLDAFGPIDFRVLAEIYRVSLLKQGETKAAKRWEKLAAKISEALSPTA